MKGMKIGIDFGSFSLKIFAEGKGIVVNEPAIAAVDAETRNPIAFGKAADDIYGRVGSDLEIVKVVKNGVISDFTIAERMLRYYLQRVCGNRIYKPNVIISIQGDISSLERKTFLDAVTRAGAGRVCMVDGILASAFGCGVESDKLGGRMVLDIGHQVTEFAVVSMGSIASNGVIRRGSYDVDKAVTRHLKRDRDIIIGPHTAREIKNKIVSAEYRGCETALAVSGKSSLDEMPISFEITSTELYPLVDEQISSLIEHIKNLMTQIPPELLGDVSDHGIKICGGGALLFDISERLSKETGICCETADEPYLAKARGLGAMISDASLLERNGYRFVFKDEIRDRMGRLEEI